MKKTIKHFICLFVAILTFGQVWATDYTFEGSTFASDKLSSTVNDQTFTFSVAHGGAGSNNYADGQGGKYIKISAGKTVTITFPTGFVASNINIKGYTNKDDESNGELSEVAGVSQSGKTFPSRNSGSISDYDFAIASNATSVTFKTKGSTNQVCLLITITGTLAGGGEEPGEEPGEDPEPDTCSESGVLFSWLPKTGLSNADISARTYDLPGDWLTSVSGGSAQLYVPSDGNMRIRGSQLAFNSNNAYIHIELDCALAAGDAIDINSSGNTNNIWLSLGSTRPSKAADAAAEIVQGTSFVLSSTRGATLIGEKEFYVWRNSSTTQVGQFTITRPYTVSFVSTHGTVPTTPTKAVSLTLEEITGVAGWVHTGWTADKAVKVGGTDKAAGAALDKTATVTISANTVFTATWEEQLCDGPTITTQPASAHYITGRAATALSCTATAGGEGDLTYTWYSCDNTSRTNPVALAGAPTPSTDEDGTFYYYCVVTEEGCGVTATSDVATITEDGRWQIHWFHS